MRSEFLVVPGKEFIPGEIPESTCKYIGTDMVVMMTPDTYVTAPGMLRLLVEPPLNDVAATNYAQQLSHIDADFFDAFSSYYHYPPASHVQGISDLEQYRSFLYSCSDTCTARNKLAIDEAEGLSPRLTAGSSIAIAKPLNLDYRVPDLAEAVGHHVH